MVFPCFWVCCGVLRFHLKSADHLGPGEAAPGITIRVQPWRWPYPCSFQRPCGQSRSASNSTIPAALESHPGRMKLPPTLPAQPCSFRGLPWLNYAASKQAQRRLKPANCFYILSFRNCYVVCSSGSSPYKSPESFKTLNASF